MTATPSWMSELPPLLARLVDGEFTPEDRTRLNDLLRQGDLPRHYYRVYMELHATLEWQRSRQNEAEIVGPWTTDITQLPSLPSSPQSVVHVETPPTITFLNSAIPGAASYFSSGWPVAYLMATAILGVALLVGSIVPVSQPMQVAKQSVLPSPSGRGAGGEGSDNPAHSHPTVGRITGMVDCRFDQRSEISDPKTQDPRPKTVVSLGDKFALSSGLMEITYDTGAKVILQGPVWYEVESKDGGYLSLGKLTAKLEKKAVESNPQSLIPNPLFAVRTPTAVVTDLGTEFGVEVDKTGVTQSHVFHGMVEVRVATADGKSETVAQVLHENESARVENRGNRSSGNRITMLGPSAEPANFVRQISKRTVKIFDLVDVVAGGDGFSGRRNAGIDPTGRATTTRSKPPRSEKDFLVGDGKYHRVEMLPFVDGVFIPDGRRGPVQVDSAGHTFDVFPETSNELPGYLWAPGAAYTEPMFAAQSVLGGIDYASSGHGLIFLHANNGVTFALDAIRRANPGYRLLRFRATTGNTEMVSEQGEGVYADVWVLVDGQSRFQRRQITRLNGAFSVAFPIGDKDRFLTLASTDGGNGVNADWIVFGDPRLELVAIEPAAGATSPSETIRN